MITITVKRLTDQDLGRDYYQVHIGPENHVCSTTKTFWINDDDDDNRAFWAAEFYAQGAAAAISTASGLAQRFLTIERKENFG